MPWNPDEQTLDALKTGWTVDGLSAGQLARHFGQTRNVIIGIVHRRGWAKAGGQSPRPRAQINPAPRKASVPLPPPAPKPSALVLDHEKFVTIDGLNRTTCRYPVDDLGPEHKGKYCGALVGETPYCDGHALIVYQPRVEKRRKKDRR